MSLPETEILIVGSGAGGGIAAWVLAEAGYKVVVLEKGPWLDESYFSNDELKYGSRDFFTQDILVEPRTMRTDPNLPAQINHVASLSRCVGGGTVHYGGASFRFLPDNFRMASLYGTPAGSTLDDWPITYDDLEPHYTAVEQNVVIAGIAPGFPDVQHVPGGLTIPPNPLAAQFGLHYSRQYPVPPASQRYDAQAFARGTMSMNPPLHPYPTPCAINTIEGFWDGVQHRHACVNCGFCNGCACPNGAKSSTLVTALRRAAATGRCEIRPECNVRRILLNSDGTAKSAVYVDRDFNEQEQPARLIILSCSTIDTPRLALLSGLDKHDPSGMIGQNFTTHHAPSAVVQINDGVHTWDVSRGTWNTISIDDLQDLQAYSRATGTPLPSGIAFPRAGVVSMVGPSPGYPFGSGGPISLALAFVKPPGFYTGGGNAFAPAGGWGPGFLTGFTGYYNTQAFLLTVCEDVPRAQNKVDLDPNVKDVYGEYVARVTYANHPNDIAVGSFVASQLPAIGEAMLNAIGARGTVVAAQTPLTSFSVGPRFNVHQHGTMRMGATPQRGVVNRYGQFWEVPNLFVADGSLMTTAGGYNPTHTIEALAHWVATHIAVNGASLLSRAPQLVPVAGAPAQLPASTPSANGSAVAALAAGTAMAGAAVSAARRRSSRRPEEPRA